MAERFQSLKRATSHLLAGGYYTTGSLKNGLMVAVAQSIIWRAADVADMNRNHVFIKRGGLVGEGAGCAARRAGRRE
ncbi:MAG TPA: hypothetical protein VGM85_08075 [Paraburkholderia sp.]|jgi:hypothetical protein